MKVSIIIAAFNAAETIAETLDSVILQTYGTWEAIVVDDGSQDATRRIVADYRRAEPRIHLIQEDHGGVCAARNRGVAGADGELLLFLDADDLILEQHLALLVEAFARKPEIGAAYSGWTRFTPDGERIETAQWPEPDDAFQALAHHVLFPIHSCLVRRELVMAAGGWDPSFLACEDWDLWLRIARMGTRFAAVPEVTALYRMRAESASLDGVQMLRDGLRVLALASSRDPRVLEPDARYADGLPGDALRAQRVYYLMWCAGIELGQKREATTLLQHLDSWGGVALETTILANILTEAIPVAVAAAPDEWPALLPGRQEAIDRFLLLLEEQTQIVGLRGEVWSILEEKIVETLAVVTPVILRKTMVLALDAERPLTDIEGGAGIERVICRLSMGPAEVGLLQLPVVDGIVTAYVLRDAIVAELAWPILEQFLRRSLLDSLEIRESEGRRSIWRGDVCLVNGVKTAQDWRAALFQEAGWTLFLQELWGRPAWPLERFYDAAWQVGEDTKRIIDAGQPILVEVSEPLRHIVTDKAVVDVVVTVGDLPVGMVQAPSEEGVARAQALRVAITQATGFELCRVAVREGLLERPLGEKVTLRERLAQAAGQRRRLGFGGDAKSSVLTQANQTLGDERLQGGGATAIIERLGPQIIDAPHSRRAALPVETLPDFERAGDLFTQAIHVEGGGPVERLFYGPEVISLPFYRPGTFERARILLRHRGVLRRLRGRNIEMEEQASTAPPGPVASAVQGQREPAPAEEARQSESAQLPILVYHRIATEAPEGLARYTLAPEKFEEQLSFLRDAGFYSITLETWQEAMHARRALPGKAVLITFDDGWEDFGTVAWPLLKQYGFGASQFLVAGEMGGVSRWQRRADEKLPLLTWDDARRMHDEGLQIGAHSLSHRRLTALSPSEMVREAIRSRILIKEELGEAVAAFAYPYGSVNAVVRHLVGACGFTFGLTYEFRRSDLRDSPLNLPRMEVRGDDDLEAFVRKLGKDPLSAA